jgi:2-oxoglutarate ferredoxin oxidoreductase subunit gamma
MAKLHPDPLRLRMTGRGGQGIMLAAALLAEAAAEGGWEVVETQEYGPEARLGATKAEIIVASRPIAFPAVDEPDWLLCLSREGWERYGRRLAAGGRRLVEASLAEGPNADREGTLYLPLRATARSLGNELATNMVALGALAVVTGVAETAALEAAVDRRVAPPWRELDRRALAAGGRLGRRVLAGALADG